MSVNALKLYLYRHDNDVSLPYYNITCTQTRHKYNLKCYEASNTYSYVVLCDLNIMKLRKMIY